MNIINDTYQSLYKLPGFIDNEYLINYGHLIDRNINTKLQVKQTHKHHIIPKCWFKINNLEIDNSITNLVNLKYRDHILAHYYLCLCTDGPLQFANELAFQCLLSRKKKVNNYELQVIHSLPLYNYIYENYQNHMKKGIHLYK